MQQNIIKKILLAIHPDVEVVDVFWLGNDSPIFTAGIEEVVDRRVRGDLRPVVIYGFDSIEKIKQHSYHL